MPYAIVRTGGKQYRVSEGEVVRVEKLEGAVGDTIEFPEILAVQGDGGLVLNPGSAKVTGKIVRHGRGTKLNMVRFLKRKGFQKRQGHRQSFTEVKIQSIA